MTEEMKAIVESNEKHIIVQAKAGCLPSNTKYFNGKEWKFISEYEEGELVLQFDPNNFKTKLVKPYRYIKQTNDTGWYKISLESGNSIICSGNHDILYYDDNLNPLKCKPMEFRKGSIAVIPNTELIKERACKLDKVLSIDKIDIGNTMEYCFTVNSGNLVVNQNGFIFTTGNCGKTSTIKEYIKSHPNEKILYTVFSSEMKKEADRSFKGLRNVEVRTFHSLAYRWWVNKNKNTRYLGLDYKQMLKQFKETTQLELKNMFTGYDLEYEDLKHILFYYNMYLCSDKLNIDDLELLDEEHDKYLQFVQMIYDYHKNHYVPVPHNFYLKEYSLSNPVLYIDTLLSDEVQDLTDASLNILLSNLDKKIIAVGDSAQSIFNFMHCKNSLKVLKEKYGFKEYKLTNSFRISDTVAGMCSRLLKWFYEEDMGFRGENITKVVKLDILEDYGEPITILSRTRIGGLLEVLNILDKFEDAKIYYYGGLEKYDLKIIENMINNKGFFFIDGERFHVNQLRKMVKEGLDDPVIKGIISRYDFIMKNEDCIELLKRTEVKSIDEANFCVNTLHSCKGSTYSIVKLAEDIGGVGNIKLRYRHYKENNLTYQAREMENQINLLYVGLSRATKYLDISKAFVKEDKIGDVFELRESLK